MCKNPCCLGKGHTKWAHLGALVFPKVNFTHSIRIILFAFLIVLQSGYQNHTDMLRMFLRTLKLPPNNTFFCLRCYFTTITWVSNFVMSISIEDSILIRFFYNFPLIISFAEAGIYCIFNIYLIFERPTCKAWSHFHKTY